MTVKVLPCPFCGSKDVEIINQDGLWAAGCQQCSAVGPLCYRVDYAGPVWNSQRGVAYPEPDWSTAPAWAQWWAVDARGIGLLYECEPVLAELEWWRVDPACRYQKAMKVDLPLGCDWRLTLRQRPEVTE